MMQKCELCCQPHPQERWRSEHFYLLDASSGEFPCFLRLVSTRHVAEMSDLSEQERKEVWKLLNVIELEIRAALKPHKINLAQFGNMVPHVHWHVIARWQDDVYFPESPWGKRQREALPEETQARRAALTALLVELPAKLDAALSGE